MCYMFPEITSGTTPANLLGSQHGSQAILFHVLWAGIGGGSTFVLNFVSELVTAFWYVTCQEQEKFPSVQANSTAEQIFTEKATAQYIWYVFWSIWSYMHVFELRRKIKKSYSIWL